jgi:uncharacterized membrane protein
MKYIEHFKASRTVKLALAKKVAGLVTLILANLSYFEASVTPSVFGCLLIGFGYADYLLRAATTKPLPGNK